MEMLGEGAPFTTPQWVLAGVATLICLISIYTDLKDRKILNVVTLPAIVVGLVLHLVFWGWSQSTGMGLKWSFIGLVAGALPFLIFVSINAQSFGMGDLKLVAALGALTGFPFILDIFVRLALAGGILAIAVLLWQGKLGRTLLGMVRRERAPEGAQGNEEGEEPSTEGYPSGDKKVYIPYGVAIAAGAIWAFVAEFSRSGMGN
ncbi:MAG: A24 family peptidase [Deltaproteobacteria bacterium]|nr:A24 family peptidase [Deltaproteobacteria bacterium]